jgi:hypothetical protein
MPATIMGRAAIRYRSPGLMMMSTAEPAPRTQVGRADLLRALSLGLDGPLTLEQNDEGWWGYIPPRDASIVQPDIASIPLQAPVSSPLPEPEVAPTNAPRPRSPLKMLEAWGAERVPSQRQDADIAPSDEAAALDAQELRPEDAPRGVWHDLVPLSRLTQPLATQLREPRSGSIDLRQLVRASAGRRWPRRLPRTVRRVWPERLIVLLDACDALFPYRHDMIRVHALLQRQVPHAQRSFLKGRDGPFGFWRTLGASSMNTVPTTLRPRSGDTWLILSDLGLLRPASELAQVWERWLRSARACGSDCVVLAPVAAQDVSPALAAQARILRWSPDSRFAPERGTPPRGDDESPALRALLACLAATSRMDPPLLRALRRCGDAAQDASLEGRVWSHPDVTAWTYACLGKEARARRLPDFEREAAPLRDALNAHVATHHAHWPYGMRLVDRMRQLVASAPREPSAWAGVRRDLHRLAHNVSAGIGDQAAAVAAADYIQRCAPHEARLHVSHALDVLAEARGGVIGERLRWCLLQRGDRHYIVPANDDRPSGHRPSGPGVVLCSDLGQAPAGGQVGVLLPQQAPHTLSLPTQGELALPSLCHGAAILLGGEETRLQRRRRTRGVWGWGQSDQGVVETLDLPWSKDLPVPNDGFLSGIRMLPSSAGGEVAVIVGRDDYGVLLALQPQVLLARGLAEDFFIRFRYLEPGTFLQGSPEGIGYEDEHPQHLVTLTQGLWLAETPCTQALWQAVMGKNPSHFKKGEDAPQRPVDSVSWGDVQDFFMTLQPLLPTGCEAVLPTESQWEYACRAGTSTEYWRGNKPEDVRANWDGQNGGTTPMGNYPPNHWGLYDVHGNIWEWCADGRRGYALEQVRNPKALYAVDGFVIRGGSWSDRPEYARAAYRLRRFHGVRRDNLGFRMALRYSKRTGVMWPDAPIDRDDARFVRISQFERVVV